MMSSPPLKNVDEASKAQMYELSKSFYDASFDDKRSVERLEKTLASTFRISSSLGISFEDHRRSFLSGMEEKHYANITGRIGRLEESFCFLPQGMEWKIKSLQHRLGNGLQEQGEGNYEIRATCVFSYVFEEGEWKISTIQQKNYSKKKIEEAFLS